MENVEDALRRLNEMKNSGCTSRQYQLAIGDISRSGPIETIVNFAPMDGFNRCSLKWSEEWRKWAWPTFRLTHGLCAELMLTEPGGASGEVLMWPYGAFKIELPTPDCPLLFVSHGRVVSASEINVYVGVRTGLGWRSHVVWMVNSDSLLEEGCWGWWPVESTIKRILEYVPGMTNNVDDAAAAAAKRIAVNLALYINSLNSGPDSEVRKKASIKIEGSTAQTRRIVIGREVKLDKRIRAAASTVNGDGTPRIPWRASYKFVVRGHWRNQRTGVGRKETTRVWVRPFWKGPDSAADALVRRYAVGGVQ